MCVARSIRLLPIPRLRASQLFDSCQYPLPHRVPAQVTTLQHRIGAQSCLDRRVVPVLIDDLLGGAVDVEVGDHREEIILASAGDVARRCYTCRSGRRSWCLIACFLSKSDEIGQAVIIRTSVLVIMIAALAAALIMQTSPTRSQDLFRCPTLYETAQGPGDGLRCPPFAIPHPPDSCPHREHWTPSDEDLERILAEHEQWLRSRDWSEGRPSISSIAAERAVLCNADLKDVNLSGANLRNADLRGVSLENTDLIGTDLRSADLRGAYIVADVNFKGAFLQGTDLRGASLNSVSLHGSNLRCADLRSAYLFQVDLGSARLGLANFSRARFVDSNLTGALLNHAFLNQACLVGVDLSRANLTQADLSSTQIAQAIIDDARFSRVDLSGSTFQPASAPASGFLTGIQGLESVRFDPGEESGLILLRKALQDAGLRPLEREATYAIERGRTRYMISQPEGPGQWIGGMLRLVFFEWTTGYGLHSSRALLILLAIMFGMAWVYGIPVSVHRKPPRNKPATPEAVSGGTYRIWPVERIVNDDGNLREAASTRIERVATKNDWAALRHGLYFSLVSAFHIGWRDLNVGSWISRVQKREYALRARGWVRVVSGIQSLISVYLLAIWVLTYFGRPFQ